MVAILRFVIMCWFVLGSAEKMTVCKKEGRREGREGRNGGVEKVFIEKVSAIGRQVPY